MIDIFTQYSLPAGAVLGSTEGKLFYGNENPIVDNVVGVPIGSYYLRDFECTMHLKHGPNQGDWTVLNAGSANRSFGAFVRTRHTDNIVLTGGTDSAVPFGVFDISTAPDVVRAPNSSSITMVEGGTYVIQYWFSAIGNPTDLDFEISVNGVVTAHDRDVVTGIAVVPNVNPNDAITVRTINTKGNNITLQEFHCMVFKLDVPDVVTEEIVDGNTQTVKVEDDQGTPVDVTEIAIGSGLLKNILDGKVELSLDPASIPAVPSEKFVTITDGTTTESDTSKVSIGSGLDLVKNTAGEVTLSVDPGIIPTIPPEKSVSITDGTNTEADATSITIGDKLELTKNSAGAVTLNAVEQTGGGSEKFHFSAYSTYNQSLSWYTRDINWDMERRKDTSHYRHDIGSTDVEVLVSGWYKVSYDVSIRGSSSSRSMSRTWLMVDGEELDGSESWAYHRTTSQGSETSSMKTMVYLFAGSKVGVRCVRQSGGSTLYTIPYASRLNIETA